MARRAPQADPLRLAHDYMAAGEHERALRAYLLAASEQGATGEILAGIGSANLALGRLGQAEQILRRAIERDPASVPAHNNLGVVLMETGRVGEARRMFERAYALDSGNTDAIRENLRRAIAEGAVPVYDAPDDNKSLDLVREGRGEYRLVITY